MLLYQKPFRLSTVILKVFYFYFDSFSALTPYALKPMHFKYVCFIVISFGSNGDCYKYRNIFITTAIFHHHAPVKPFLSYSLPYRTGTTAFCTVESTTLPFVLTARSTAESQLNEIVSYGMSSPYFRYEERSKNQEERSKNKPYKIERAT